MSGICGWFNPSHDDQRPIPLERMLSRLGAGPKSAIGDGGRNSLGSAGNSPPCGVGRRQNLLIAWQGWVKDAPGQEADPAAHIANLYRRHGEGLLAHLKGPCILALIDLKDDCCILATDRLGTGTLYFAAQDGGVTFGTTAEAVLAHPAIDRTLDLQSIFNYLYFHVVPAPRSIYRGISRLLPGECLVARPGQLDRRFYWQAPYQDENPAAPADLMREFQTLLYKSVERCAQDGTVGAFLSGGTDSSTVSGMLRKVRGSPVDTYSIGFEAEGFDETSYAKIAAHHFGTRYHEYYVTHADVCSAIPLLAAAYDEPFGNASAVPAYYCSRLAADDGIHTLLAGDGGDEIFAGNARYAKQKVFELYGFIPSGIRQTLIEPLALSGASRLSPLRKLRSYIEQARIPLPDRMETYNFLHQEDLREIFDDGFLEAIDPTEPLRELREIYLRTTSQDPVNRMMHVDLKITLADSDLRKVGRMAELAGIQVRYPLLDEDLVEFAARVPAAVKLKRFQLRSFFKQALNEFLPPEILSKTKHGFGLPFGLWMHEHAPLRDLAYDSLETLKRRNYLRPTYLDKLKTLHQDRHSTYYGTMIWVLMMLEQWLHQRQSVPAS